MWAGDRERCASALKEVIDPPLHWSSVQCSWRWIRHSLSASLLWVPVSSVRLWYSTHICYLTVFHTSSSRLHVQPGPALFIPQLAQGFPGFLASLWGPILLWLLEKLHSQGRCPLAHVCLQPWSEGRCAWVRRILSHPCSRRGGKKRLGEGYPEECLNPEKWGDMKHLGVGPVFKISCLTQQPAWRGFHWPNMGQFEHQNK